MLAGNGVARSGAAPALRAFAHATGMGVAATFMGKGVLDADDPHWRGTVGLQSRDYELAGFEHADVVITVGYDLVEHAPVNWNPDGTKRIVCIDTTPAEVDEHFITAIDLIGDIDLILRQLTALCGTGNPATTTPSRLNDLVGARSSAAATTTPSRCTRRAILWEIRQALGREDILISDVGLHKLWIARLFPAHEPDTVFIANGLAGMGIALPTAIAAQLVHRDRKVVTVNGDGGFLMNCQELETAKRLGLPVVNVIWENKQFGSIVWKQDKKFGRHFGVDFTNPDFVKLAEAFGIPGFRCEAVEDFAEHLKHCLELDEPSILVAPDRLLGRHRPSGATGNGDCGRMSTISPDKEQSVVESVPTGLYIGGEWRDGANGDTIAVEDPSTGETIAEVADATPEDAKAALDAAVEMREEWAATAPRDRGEILRRAFEADHRARRRAGAADDARDGQAAGRVQGGDHLRRRVPALVLRGGGADRGPLRARCRTASGACSPCASRSAPAT